MSLEIPGWLQWVGDLIGEDFPEGDEDKVWEQAARWKQLADQLQNQKSTIEAASRATLSGFGSGEAHDAMRTEFATLTSGDASIDVLVKQMRELSDAVEQTGTQIQFAKEMYLANLAILAATLAALAASVVVNWFAPVEGAAAVAATEVVISQIIRAAIAKVIEAGASKVITQLVLRALQGAAINAVIGGGLNAGIQLQQMAQGHRHEFDGASFGNDIKGGAIAGAVAFPLLHGAKAFDAGSPLANRVKTFGASFTGNTVGALASQQALTGHMDFGQATTSGLLYGGIDSAFPAAAGGPRVSPEVPAMATVSDRPASFGPDKAFGGESTAAARPEGAATTHAAAEDNAAAPAATHADRSVSTGDPATAPAGHSTTSHPDTTGSAASNTAGTPARPAEVSAPTRSEPAGTAPSPNAATGAPPRAALSSAPGGHVGIGEPTARVADAPAVRTADAPVARTAASVSPGAHPVGELAASRPAGTGHEGSEPARTAVPAGDRADPSGPGPAPDRHASETPNPAHQGPPGETPQPAAHPPAEHGTPDHGPAADRTHDNSTVRQTADDALSRRIPPVEPESLRAPHGSRDQAVARAHDNADWWHSLDDAEQRALIETYPQHVGNAEGIPAAARHEANSHAIAQEREQLHTRQDNGERLTRAEQKHLNRLDKLDAALQDARRTAEAAGVGGPHILAFDPAAFHGEGRAIVAFGDDPYRAGSVSWHVPGLTTTIDSLGTNIANAFNHLQSTRAEHPGISASSIAWIGYDAPSGRGSWRVAFPGLAREGGNILHSDIAAFNVARDLLAGDGSHFTNNHVFGHSYGSTTTSYAGEGGRLHDQVRTVTLLGSPGAGPHRTADGFGIGRDNVFVASSSRDWVTTLGGRDSPGRFLGHFGLGRDPAMDHWGGTRVTSEFPVHMDTPGTVGTHTSYYHYVEGPGGGHLGVRSESLANFGRIASGHPERLDLEGHRREVDGPRWRPGLRTEEPAAGRPLRLHDDLSGREHSVDRRAGDPRWHRGPDDTGAGAPRSPGPSRDDGGGSGAPHPPRGGPPLDGPADRGPDADHQSSAPHDSPGAADHPGDHGHAARPDPAEAVLPVLERYQVALTEFTAMQERAAVVGRDNLAATFTTDELRMMYEARAAHPHPGPDALIQKVVSEGAVRSILDQVAQPGSEFGGGGPYKADGVGGCVSVRSDAAHLSAPRDLLRALRLDYGNGSPYELFTTTDHAYVIEGLLADGDLSVPNGRVTQHLGIDDPHAGDLDDGSPPHTGTGYTGDPHGLNPEYKLDNGRWAPGATLVRIDPDGSRHPIAVLDDRGKAWVSAKEPGDTVVDAWPPHKGGEWVFPNSTEHGAHPELADGGPPRAGSADDAASGAGPPVPHGHSPGAAADAFRQATMHTDAGAAFFDPTDTTMRAAADTVPRFPGEFTVDVHGDRHGVSVWDGAGRQHSMTAGEFAEVLRDSTDWDGHSPIRLLSCDTGSGPHPFAADLARELGVPVTAPDRPVWTFPDGREPVVTGVERGPGAAPAPRIPPDGSWHQFGPDGDVEPMAAPSGAGHESSHPGGAQSRAGDEHLPRDDQAQPLRSTVPASDAPNPDYTPADVDQALDHAPRDDAGAPLDHRSGRPLRLHDADGHRGWVMRWDPDQHEWVAENRALDDPGGMPPHGEPNSFGYDEAGDLKQYANHRPSYDPTQVQDVWDLSRVEQVADIHSGRLDLPDPGADQQWVRIRDDAQIPEDWTTHRVERAGLPPETFRLIEWRPEVPQEGLWDMGHVAGQEYRELRGDYLRGDLTVDEFLEQYRDPENYRVQDPGRNRSHVDEGS